MYACLWICFVWLCKLWLPVIVRWTCVVLYICMNKCCMCSHVWMAPGKISCKLTRSPYLNKVFELNWIEFAHILVVSLISRTAFLWTVITISRIGAMSRSVLNSRPILANCSRWIHRLWNAYAILSQAF